MKALITFSICFFFNFHVLCAQQLLSKVYSLNTRATKTATGSNKTMFSGSGAVLSKHQLNCHTIVSDRKLVYNGDDADELFFIVKYGPVHIVLNGQAFQLDKGSVIFLLPGDKLTVENKRKDDVEVYEMRMVSQTGRNESRGKSAGPSFVINWDDMVYKPHNRGCVRQLFDRKTVMLNRFDIHITSLNPEINSHEPHTHKNEEIILMIDGVGEMQLGASKQTIVTGDAAWVESEIPHNFTNTGKRPAVYFAIQWN